MAIAMECHKVGIWKLPSHRPSLNLIEHCIRIESIGWDSGALLTGDVPSAEEALENECRSAGRSLGPRELVEEPICSVFGYRVWRRHQYGDSCRDDRPLQMRYAHVGDRETEAAAQRIGAAIAQAPHGYESNPSNRADALMFKATNAFHSGRGLERTQGYSLLRKSSSAGTENWC